MSTTEPEPFTLDGRPGGPRRPRRAPAETRWPDDPDNESGRFGVPRAYLEDFVGWWLDEYDWRAVEARDQRAAELPGDDRRPGRPLRARSRQGARPAADRAHARVAVELLGLPQGDRPAVRPRVVRRRSGRRVRRHRAVDPGLRILDPDAPRLEREEDRGAVGAPRARRARPRPLRHCGRRLGRGHLNHDGTPPSRRPARRVRDAAELRTRVAQPVRGIRARRPRARRARVVRTRVAQGARPGRPIVRTDRNLFAPQTDTYAGTDSPLALAVDIVDGRRATARPKATSSPCSPARSSSPT